LIGWLITCAERKRSRLSNSHYVIEALRDAWLAMLRLHGEGSPIIREVTMTIRSNGALAGFGWLKRGISLGFRHPKSLLGVTVLLLLAITIPALVQMLLQFVLLRAGTPPSTTTFALIFAAPMLLSLLILPLYAGYLQVIEAVEQGLPARARDIFKPYQQGNALNVVGYGLTLIVIYVVLLGLIIAVSGSGIPGWYMQLLTAQANHLPPPTTLPHGFWPAIGMILILGIFMLGFYATGFGQVALRRRGLFGAIGDGFVGTFKNLLPLLVFAVGLLLIWLCATIAVVIVVLLLALIGKLVGAWLVVVVVVPLYIALLLVMTAGMFGVMYHLWRDVCGSSAVPYTDLPLAA
jgi:hypothetical protein